MVPRKGAQVAQFTGKDIQDVLEVRASLEALAAKLACKHMDERSFLKLQLIIAEYEYAAKEDDIEVMIQKDIEFHDTIAEASRNEKLVQLYNNMREQVQRYRITYLKNTEESSAVIAEHNAMLEALKNRDSELASQLATKHIETQCSSIMKFIQSKK